MIQVEKIGRDANLTDIKCINNCLNINYGRKEPLELTYRKAQDTAWSYKVLRSSGIIVGYYRVLGLKKQCHNKLYYNQGLSLSELVDEFEGANIDEHSEYTVLTSMCILPELRFIGLGGLLLDDFLKKYQGHKMLVPTFDSLGRNIADKNGFVKLFKTNSYEMWYKHM